MSRVRLYVVGSLVLVALAGCGRSWFNFGERAPWRRDAEIACLKSGAVKNDPGVVRIEPIEGPGICGADFPLKVSALGAPGAVGYADELQPPGLIPNVPVQPRWSPIPPRNWPLPPPTAADVEAAAPLLIHPSDGSEDLPPPGAEPPAITPAYPLDRSTPEMTRLPARSPDLASPPATVLHTPLDAFPPTALHPPVPLGPARAPVTGAIGPVAVNPPATLACPIVSVLDKWIATTVQPAALRWFGQPVVAIHQISAYSCRGMNGNPHAHISEHAFGNALDIAGFTFADGRKLTVKNGWHGSPEEQGFLHDVQGGACDDFTTVLSPGYNVYHYNHIHVDLMRRSRQVCRPTAVPGEVAAARARSRMYAHRGEPGVTGSIDRADAADAPPAEDEDFVLDRLPESED